MQSLQQLLDVMAQLRDKEKGCPWDIEQTFSSIAPYTIEEAYEVADAIEQQDYDELKSELGDLLFQVVFHAQMAQEKGLFCFEDVVNEIVQKLIRRHPHVFAEESVTDKEQLAERWEQHKIQERETKPEHSGVLAGVASSLPALLWSQKLQKRAARTGFDWPNIEPVFDKLDEEVQELRDELHQENNQLRVMDEYGDVLFVCVNLGKHLDVSAEEALRHANQKFIQRFTLMEKLIAGDGASLDALGLEQMEAYWQRAKKHLAANERE